MESRCIDGRNGRRELALGSDQINAIVDAMAALRTTCTKRCGAPDSPDVTLMVRDCAERTEGSFNSNFYAGCLGQMVTPPYLDFDDILSLQNVLGGIIASSCNDQDAGDGGTCRPICRQVFW